MADTGENPFVIGHREEMAAPPDAAAEQQQQQQQQIQQQHQQDGDDAAEAQEDVAGLIPLCVRHAEGPQINSAVFGYDIAQMQKRPWDDPAANLKDYFNYGFNETSWRLYCSMQAEGEASLLARANTFLAQLKGGSTEEPIGNDNAPYCMQTQGSSQAYYGRPQDSFRKTRLCQRFLDGRCVKGEHCSYAHGQEELRGGAHQHQRPQQQQHHLQHQQHLQHHHHHHHHHQQHQHPQSTSYILPPFSVDQGVLPPMSPPPTGVLDPNGAGGYRMMPKRQRSPDKREDQAY
ncbi:FIP1-like protein [Trypanosoma grayi]|uniref:FIP1-like protein n=1 Tax=Trypanosoma grayi TaxID=71804 RepID=UPI0004F41AF3|nr:FIP1-like protein [Trypanosoma grayi]KEG07985.1 FIP1-like protein [Trypanosoma grayi]